jgi:putative acetyltransferase
MPVSNIEILEARSDGEIADVVSLLRDYFAWLACRYAAEKSMIAAAYNGKAREAELADLRGHYDAILMARVNGVPAGCVMFRRQERDACEMKRMFVRPVFQGRGVARALICRLVKLAAIRGYRAIRLETGPRQFEAQALYLSVGFHRTAPYYAIKGWLADNMLFFEADVHDIDVTKKDACAPRESRPRAA